jgi:uncharacterized damage-inducible protein DinB
MRLIDPVLQELERETSSTLKMLERLPDGQLDWRPHPRSKSLGDLAWHLATIPSRIASMLQASSFDVAASRPAPRPDTAAAITAAFRSNLDEARAMLAALDDDALREKFTMTRDGREMVSLPKIGVIRTVLLNHSYHHRGQLSVYLRLLDVPLPPVYGSTADESV